MSKQEPEFRIEKTQQTAGGLSFEEAVVELRIPIRQLAMLIAMYLPTKESTTPPTALVNQDDAVTPQEAATILKCGISTIYRRTRDNQLPYYRLGDQKRGPIFIKRSDLEKLKKSTRLNGVRY